MKPATDLVLTAMVKDMEKKLAFMPPGGERMMLNGMKVMLDIVARHADDGAAMRLQEIDELANLLRRAAPSCAKPLADLLLAAAGRAETARDDVRLSALQSVLDTQCSALISLQADLDVSTHPQAPALTAACWEFLVRANARRTVAAKPW